MRTNRGHSTPRRIFSVVATLGLVTGLLAAGALPAGAATQTTAVSDPTGDALYDAPGFMDIVRRGDQERKVLRVPHDPR